ncbi:adenosine deaminase [Bifidobacterium miconisargentati]|uniref:adenosine deaminase n=1 Tax=Bifidobacterium miconisargentati TaxID=2834437 RepID=UPI001BDCCE64|nr:adenosine deaminase [Bifidobacterium miconisargentati]MBW3091091.1 adenosine deaminase [Bifidobacterium miconisargentati]
MVDESMRAALRALPKAELHLHIEGTLEPELALELAERNGVMLPWTSLDELKRQYAFENLQSFLDLYYQLMAVLKTADDFRDLMLAYLKRAAADGVRHAEIFFDPQVHLGNGLDLDTVMDGLLEGLRLGRERYGIGGGLILCIVRDLPVESARHVLELAAPRAADLIGIGLDSAEVGYPPSLFADVFVRARELGLHCVAPAGEEGPAAYVTEALDLLHAERIDHGVHAADDPAVTRRLAEEHIPLTCCPLSNRRLQVVHDLRDLPLRKLIEAGVTVTVNSDDPAYFGGYIGANYEALAEIGFTYDELKALAADSIRASFLPEADKRALLG